MTRTFHKNKGRHSSKVNKPDTSVFTWLTYLTYYVDNADS